MTDIKCPYCGTEQDINHDDGYGYSEDVKHTQECDHCAKSFIYTTSIMFYYEAEAADCLNDGKHNFEPTHTQPKQFTKMRCTVCDEERKPTDEEMKLIMINEIVEPF